MIKILIMVIREVITQGVTTFRHVDAKCMPRGKCSGMVSSPTHHGYR
jgi:hypothetical protein